MALTWNDQLPQSIFARPLKSTQAPQEYYIMYSSKTLGVPVIYRQGVPEPLLMGNLPDFGKFDVQLVSFFS